MSQRKHGKIGVVAEEQERQKTSGELDTLLEKVRSLENEKNELLGKVAEAQDKQSELQLDKDHLTQIMGDLSRKRESLLGRVKALKSERDKLQVTFTFEVDALLAVLLLFIRIASTDETQNIHSRVHRDKGKKNSKTHVVSSMLFSRKLTCCKSKTTSSALKPPRPETNNRSCSSTKTI